MFTTFLIKEEVKEHQKDLLLELETAKANYAEDKRTNSIMNDIDELEYIRITENIKRSSDIQTGLQAKIHIVTDNRTFTEYGTAYRAAYRLKAVVPKDKKIDIAEANVEPLRKKVLELTESAQSFGTLEDASQLTKEQVDEVKQEDKLASDYSRAVPAFIDLVLQKTEEEERRRRERVRFWTHASWVLYPVGWVLTFCGSLLEPEKKNEELTPEP